MTDTVLDRTKAALAEALNQRQQLVNTLIEVLAHFREPGHPGEPCLRTGWIKTASVEQWHGLLGSLKAIDASVLLAPQRHVIAFDADGTWSLEHPPACRVEHDAADAAEWDCPVRKLAEKQMPDAVTLMAGGRYECSVGDLGDVFLLGDRIDGEG